MYLNFTNLQRVSPIFISSLITSNCSFHNESFLFIIQQSFRIYEKISENYFTSIIKFKKIICEVLSNIFFIFFLSKNKLR